MIMTVAEMIEVLQKVEDKTLPLVFTDYVGGEMLVSNAELQEVETWDGKKLKAIYLDTDGAF
jgi:hypothetical protein